MSRILVIDDDVELCELLNDYLTPEGFEVETVNRSEPGIERAITDRAIRLHGGSVVARNVDSGGLLVRISIPC